MVHSPLLSLKVIVVGHFILSLWASMSPQLGLQTSYIYMNAFILAFGVWSIICPESIDAISMFLLLHGLSIILDIIFLGIFGSLTRENHYIWTDLYRFSMGMAITNLILKPFTSFVLFRIYQDRGGQYSDFRFPEFGSPGTSDRGYRGYNDIDGPSAPVETAAPHSSFSG